MFTHKDTINHQHKPTDQPENLRPQINSRRANELNQTSQHLIHSELEHHITQQKYLIRSPKLKANEADPHSPKKSHPQVSTDSRFREFATLLKRGFAKMTSAIISATHNIRSTNQISPTNQRLNMSSTPPTRSSKRKTERYSLLTSVNSSNKQSIWVKCPYQKHMGITPSLTGDIKHNVVLNNGKHLWMTSSPITQPPWIDSIGKSQHIRQQA
jgi:hypothetical protein